MAAEILFLRRQLALLQERGARPRRARHFDRLWLVLLSLAARVRDSLRELRAFTTQCASMSTLQRGRDVAFCVGKQRARSFRAPQR
jgi:hypothetical protein